MTIVVLSSRASSIDGGHSVAERVQEILTPTIGKFTARKAIELAAQRCGCGPEGLDSSHTGSICETLRPMLRTLIGSASAERVLTDLRRALGQEGP